MSYYKDEFLIINSKYFKEKDISVVVLSKKFGKRDINIRGVRNIKSRYRGATEPLTLCSGIVHYKNNSDYYTLSSVEVIDLFYNIENLTNQNELYFILGLINYFMPYNHVINNFYTGTLKFLKLFKETNNKLISFYYALWLLKKVGYQPNTDYCSYCLEELTDVFKIDTVTHSILCKNCFKDYKPVYYSNQLLSFLKYFYSGTSVKISDLLNKSCPEFELRKFLKNYLNILIEYNSRKMILNFL